MKRWRLRIALCLVFGAVTTLAVAWGSARFEFDMMGNRLSGRAVDDVVRAGWTVHVESGWTWTIVTYMYHDYAAANDPDSYVFHRERMIQRGSPHPREILPQWAAHLMDLQPSEWTDGPGTHSRALIARGWPFRSMQAEYIGAFTDSKMQIRRGVQELEVNLQGRHGNVRKLLIPLLPMPLGFAVDTAAYGVMWWVLLALPFLVRRTMRVHRGRCPCCGYDLRGQLDSGCPECGWNRDDQEARSRGDEATA